LLPTSELCAPGYKLSRKGGGGGYILDEKMQDRRGEDVWSARSYSSRGG